MSVRLLNNLELFLIKKIYESSCGIGLFTLFKRSKVSSKEFYIAILNLQQSGYVVENDHYVKLTEDGNNFVMFSGLYSAHDKNWRAVPKHFLQPQLNIDEKYPPNIFALDEKMFDFGGDKE